MKYPQNFGPIHRETAPGQEDGFTNLTAFIVWLLPSDNWHTYTPINYSLLPPASAADIIKISLICPLSRQFGSKVEHMLVCRWERFTMKKLGWLPIFSSLTLKTIYCKNVTWVHQSKETFWGEKIIIDTPLAPELCFSVEMQTGMGSTFELNCLDWESVNQFVSQDSSHQHRQECSINKHKQMYMCLFVEFQTSTDRWTESDA